MAFYQTVGQRFPCSSSHLSQVHLKSGSSGIALWPHTSHRNQPSARVINARNSAPSRQYGQQMITGEDMVQTPNLGVTDSHSGLSVFGVTTTGRGRVVLRLLDWFAKAAFA